MSKDGNKGGAKGKTKLEPIVAKVPELSVVLIPADVRARAETFTREASKIAAGEITSAAALETADNLAAEMKALETEIETTTSGMLKPIKGAIKALEVEIGALHDPLVEARQALAQRVVESKPRLGVEAATSCYVQTRDKLEIRDLHKIPHTIKLPSGEVVQLLKVDEAAVKRAIKANVHVPGVYIDEQQIVGVRS
jgi:hypothetical protein